MAGPLRAATFTVTQTGSTGPGSLPVVINTANAAPGDNIVEFSVAGTIGMVAPLPVITNNLTINGRSNIVISGSGVTNLFTFSTGTISVLSELTIRDAMTTGNGAAISNAGTLILTGCVLTNNSANSGKGGAIYNAGNLTMSGCTVVSNKAGAGGAIYSTNTTTISTSVFAGNQSTNGNGGAIYSSAPLNISNSALVGNTAGNGGAVYSLGSLTVSSLTISSNQAHLAFGGGVFSADNLSATASAFLSNSALGENGRTGWGGGGGGAGLGGGLFHTNGVASLTNCTFSSNLVQGGNGGASTSDQYSSGGGPGGGNNRGSAGSGPLSGSPGGFGGGGGGGGSGNNPNTAGGAGGSFGGAGGGLYAAGSGGNGCGGAVFTVNSVLTLVNCTLVSNNASSSTGLNFGAGRGGGIYSYQSSGSASTTLLNTIIAGNMATTSSPDLLGLNFSSSGFNLIGNSQGAAGLSINDYQNVSAGLGPLQDNSGPTWTHALLPGSLAIDGGNNIGAPSADQRGVTRPQGSAVDIGAVEYLPFSATVSLSASPSGSGTVSGGGTFTSVGSQTVTATANTGYAFANWTENGAVISTSASYTFTVNGNRTLVANFTATPVNYTLILSALPSAGGVVVGGGTFAAGISQTVTAAANSGYTFANWTEGGTVVSSSANYTFTVGGNRTLVANFTANPVNYTLTLSASPSGGGTVSGGGTFTSGSSRTVTATANSGYTFANWTEGGAVVSSSASYTFTVSGNRTLVANFTANPVNYILTLSASPSGGGTVSGGGTFAGGSSRTVTAVANSGYAFANWTDTGFPVSLSANYTFTLNGNRTLVANFTANPVITTQPLGQSIAPGDSVTLSVSSTGTGLSYQWQFNGTNLPGATSQTLSLSNLAATNAGAYRVVVSSTSGGSVTSQIANLLFFGDLKFIASTILAGPVGQQFRVDYADVLASVTNWLTLTNVTLPYSPFLVIDPASPGRTNRYYRAVPLP